MVATVGGKREPEVARKTHMVNHWQVEVSEDQVPEDYWATLAGTNGGQGPISIMRHTSEKSGDECMRSHERHAGGDAIDVRGDFDTSANVAAAGKVG